MRRAAISVLKAHLSEYIESVKAGEEVLVTDRGRPVARLMPLGPRGAGFECLEALERSGVVRVGSGRLPKAFWDLPRPEDAGGKVLAALREEREDER